MGRMQRPYRVGRVPAGPRGRLGRQGEDVAAAYLVRLGWSVVGRNVRVGRIEVDIIAIDPSYSGIVIVEVRARTVAGFGDATESVDAAKVRRLYRAAGVLQRDARVRGGPDHAAARVDLVTLRRDDVGRWRVTRHLTGLESP